jgi:hypothetical protein
MKESVYITVKNNYLKVYGLRRYYLYKRPFIQYNDLKKIALIQILMFVYVFHIYFIKIMCISHIFLRLQLCIHPYNNEGRSIEV